MRLLLIEDDERAASFIMKGFKESGYAVDHVTDGEQGFHMALNEPYDAAIVDIMLPKVDGLTLIGELRRKKSKLPVIILSARGATGDRVKGLQIGSDDYMTKPFAFSELLARVQALLRRASGISEPTSLTVGDLSLNLLTREVARAGTPIDLQPREFALLEYLMRNAGRVVSKTMIMEHVWDYNFDPHTNVVEACVCRLRKESTAVLAPQNSSIPCGVLAMFLKRLLSARRTLVFRLTLWYAAIFTVSSLLAFLVFYLGIASIVRARTDAELAESIEEFSALLAGKGLDAVKRAMIVEAKDDGESKVFYRLLSSDGTALESSNLTPWGRVPINGDAVARVRDGADPEHETLALGARTHGTRVLYGALAPGIIMQTGLSLEEDDEFLARFHNIFGTTVALVMAFAALIGWFMAKRAMASVEEISCTAEAISAGDLKQRVPVKGRGSEIDRLAITFNGMLDRIQALVTEMKEMTENIAHDLRSPITRIRGTAEMTLTTAGSIDEYESAVASTVEDCDRLLEMINTMLYLSEAEAMAGRPIAGEVDLTQVVRDACDLFQPVAEDKGVSLVADINGQARVRGENQALQRMVANLIDNALNYTEPPGRVTVTVNGNENQVVLSVADTGMGIPQEEIPRIFKRFYRCDRSRSRPGVGLGLSLVKAIVQSHRGEIAVASTPNVETKFTVTLPRAAATF